MFRKELFHSMIKLFNLANSTCTTIFELILAFLPDTPKNSTLFKGAGE